MSEEEGFDVKKFFKANEGINESSHSDNIDELNDETFGDGAGVDDWEISHRASTNTGSNVNVIKPAEQILSKFQDCTLKDLWDDHSPPKLSPNPQASTLHTIWSSPDIPSPSRKPNNVPIKMRTVEDLERDMLDSSSPSHPPSPPPSQHNLPPHVFHTLQPSPQSHSPPQGVFMHPRPPLLPYFPMAGPHPPHRVLMPRGPHPPFLMRGHLPPNVPLMGPPHIIPRGVMLPPPGHPHAMQFRPVIGPRPHNPQYFPPPFRHSSKLNELLCDLKPDGSGFMTQKEKEWIIKVQLLQLHTTTPEVEDYYYQCYMQKKFSQQNKDEGVVSVETRLETLTLPPPVNQEDKKREKLEFKNTLGKISFSSVSAPRKMIDVSQSSSNEGTKKETITGSRKRHILLTIEEMYNLLHKLRDLRESHQSFSQLRQEICDEIFELTNVQLEHDGSLKKEGEAFFQQILNFRKGKRVLQQALLCLSESQAKILLLCVSSAISNIVRKDATDKVLPELLPSVNGVILTLTLIEVCQHVSCLAVSPLTVKLTDNLFFIDYLSTLLKRGDLLVKSCDQADEIVKKWSLTLERLQSSLLLLKADSTHVLIEQIRNLTTSRHY